MENHEYYRPGSRIENHFGWRPAYVLWDNQYSAFDGQNEWNYEGLECKDRRIDHAWLSGQHYNQCDKATNKDQAREREEREREK